MRRSVLVSPMVVIGLSAMIAFAETKAESEKQLIPLKDIWGFEMPGTLDIQKLNPKSQLDATERIQRSLSRHDGANTAGPGFVVQGDETDALIGAFAVLVSNKEASSKVRRDLSTWIVFYSKETGQYVRLRSIKVVGKQITVDFTFVPHETKNLSCHFALIPLGKLATGKHKVSIVNSPMDKRYLDQHFTPLPKAEVRAIVAQSFEFDVSE